MSNMRVLSTPVGAGQGTGSLVCVCHPILQTPFRGAYACVANTTSQLTICILSVPLMAHDAHARLSAFGLFLPCAVHAATRLTRF